MIFEKDDIVLKLESMMHDCKNIEQRTEFCEIEEKMAMKYVDDLRI